MVFFSEFFSYFPDPISMFSSLSNLLFLPESLSPMMIDCDEDGEKFSKNSTKPERNMLTFLISILKSIASFSYLSETYINKLAEEFSFCKGYENEILFKESDKIACFLVLAKGCLEIINKKNSQSCMLIKGGSFGESAIFIHEFITNLTIKAVDDCLFFKISKSAILNFFKKIIKCEYDLNSFAINEILLFKRMPLEKKERMAICAMKQKIMSDEIRKVEPIAGSCLLKEREKYIFLNVFNRNILEIHMSTHLEQILKSNELFSNFNKTHLAEMISKMKLKYCQNNKKIYEFESEQQKKIFIIMKGVVEEKNGEKKLKEGDIFNNINNKEYISNDNTIIAELGMEIYEVFRKKSQIKRKKTLEINSKILYEDFFNNLIFLENLGEGQFGKVILVKEKTSQEYFALKCISKSQKYYDEMKTSILEEKRILENVNYPFIVHYKGYYEDEIYHYFMMEYIKGIELFEVMKQMNYFSMDQSKFYAASMILILEYLHSNGIIYLDLKPENVMVDENGFLKLIDMGASIFKGENHGANSIRGTLHYIAPELIRGGEFNYSADLWSLGIVLYELICGFLPFGENCEDQFDIFDEILNKQLEIPSFVDALTCELLQKLLNKDPEERSKESFEDIKSSNYFEDFDWEGLIFKKIKTPFVPSNILKNENLHVRSDKVDRFFSDILKEEFIKIKESKSKENLIRF